MDFGQVGSLIYKWFFISGFKIVLIIFAAMFINRTVNSFFKRLIKAKKGANFEQDKNIQTIYSIFKSIIRFVVVSVGLMLILEELGVNIGPILAAAGVLGVAVGFGSQRLVEDFISGFIILINNQIRVGDVVQIDGKSGTVEKVTLNMVVLRDDSGDVHFIRNGRIGVVTNMTKDFSYCVLEVGVDYKENIEQVIEIIKNVSFELKNNEKFAHNILAPIEILGLDKFGESKIFIKAKIKTKPNSQWALRREFNFKLKKTFDEQNIKIS